MNRLDARFKGLAGHGRKALIGYLTGAYPSMRRMEKAARDLERAGADVIEIGVPFSDPIADGPTIQYSSQRALETGVTLFDLLAWARRFRKTSNVPLVFMSYANPIHHVGYARFARLASDCGIDGLIVPDMIPEESRVLRRELDRRRVALICLVAPTTPPERQKWVARQSRGFLYAVSVTGVTGARKSLPAGTAAFLKGLSKVSPVPVAVGFGISTPEQAREMARHADGIIVGSAIIKCLRENRPLRPFIASLRRALDK